MHENHYTALTHNKYLQGHNKVSWCQPCNYNPHRLDKERTGSIFPNCNGKCGCKRKTTSRNDVFLLRENKKDLRRQVTF